MERESAMNLQHEEMQNLSFPIPSGFRFCPTDEEIVEHYLVPKVVGHPPIHPGVIAQVDVYEFAPFHLRDKAFYSGNNNMFFFTPRKMKFEGGTRIKRSIKEGGFWRMSSKSQHINGGGRYRGKKNTLVYHKDQGIKTNWIMHEYVLDHQLPRKLEDMVVCKIFLRKPEDEAEMQSNMEIMTQIDQVYADPHDDPMYWIGSLITLDEYIKRTDQSKKNISA